MNPKFCIGYRLTKLEKRIGGYDLMYSDGPVYANPTDAGHAGGWDNGPKLNSFLGKKYTYLKLSY